MPFYSKNCPACKKNKIKENFSEKILLGKLLYFKYLCKEFAKGTD